MSNTSDYQTIVINWSGPVSEKSLEEDSTGGLYIFTGKLKYERNDNVQYIGITERGYLNRFVDHHKADLIKNNFQCWFGKIVHPADFSRIVLERAESMLIFVVQPELNERKRVKLPRRTAVISHWFNDKGKPRYNRSGVFEDFPDVISWDGKHWREGNLRVWDEI